MPISPLGVVAGRIRRQIMKASHRFTICVPLQLLAYLLPFRSYSTFLFWLGFPIWGGQKWRFSGPETPKSWFLVILTSKRHFLASNHVIWAIKRNDRRTGLGWGRTEEIYNIPTYILTDTYIQKKCTLSLYFTPTWGRPLIFDRYQNWHRCWPRLRNQSGQIWYGSVKEFLWGNEPKFGVFHLRTISFLTLCIALPCMKVINENK